MHELVLSSAFDKQLKKFLKNHPHQKTRISKTLKLLQTNLNHPSLRLHKLAGENNWSVSVTKGIRIVVHWDQHQLFLSRIGSHDQAYR